MSGYVLLKLDDLISRYEEDKIVDILSSFSCSMNLDVAEFLHEKAIPFSNQGIAKVHIVMASFKDEYQIAGYFALANKSFVVKAKSKAISRTMKKRIAKFGVYDEQLKQYVITAPLIGLLGKNDNYSNLITGDELLELACQEVKKAQQIIGGKLVYLECEDAPKLKDFYERNGFIIFGERTLDPDETSKFTSHKLLQLLKYLH